MANYKISELGDTAVITDDDFFPVVDNGSSTTQRVDAQVIKAYVTGSVVNSLSASVLSGSDTYTTTLTSSYTTGSDAKLTTLSASFVTGSDAKFTSISASSITANEYNVVTINRTTLSQEGSTKFGDDSLDTHQFSGSIYVSGNVSGSRAEFTSLTGALDWSYVENTPTTLTGYGITDSVTLDTEQTINGRKTFTTHYITASITGSNAKFTNLSGNLLWSYISEAPAFITSNQTITLSGDATGSGTTDISVGDVSASFIKAGTDGSTLSNLSASQLLNFTNDVRSQFTAGTDISIVNGAISSTVTPITPGGSEYSVQFNSGSSFSGSSNLLYNYDTNILDINGSIVANVLVSGSIASPISSTSYTLSSIDRGKTLLFSSSATQSITCSSGLAVGYNATFIQMGDGQLILSGASGVELLNRQAQTGSAGQYAAISVIVIDSNKIIIAGDTV